MTPCAANWSRMRSAGKSPVASVLLALLDRQSTSISTSRRACVGVEREARKEVSDECRGMLFGVP
jgi:hypothetical protein